VVEVKGRSEIGDAAFEWSESELFVAPSWAPQRHRPESEAILFSFSDGATQEKLGIWRERRPASAA
jgi:gentisate 1,2-dioxygenase